MTELLLSAAEQTPDWDLQRLRGHIVRLEEVRYTLTHPQAHRHARIVERFRGRIAVLTGLAAACPTPETP